MSELSIQLQWTTPPEWIEVVQSNFNEFLQNHAACERKASATGMMFVVRYPDKSLLIESMIQLSREELMHFHQVWRLMQSRGLKLKGDARDPYINALLECERKGSKDYGLLDRLLIFALAEARGQERFAILGQKLKDPAFREFYTGLAEAEERHYEIFLRLALEYGDQNEVINRLDELTKIEAEISRQLPLRPSVH